MVAEPDTAVEPDTAAAEPAATDEPAPSDAPADEPPKGSGGSGANPFTGLRNGRAEDHTPPELSSGDPLVTRETRS